MMHSYCHSTFSFLSFQGRRFSEFILQRVVIELFYIFLIVASRQGYFFSLFQQLHTYCIFLNTLPLETVFRTHNLLDWGEEPAPDL